ncbi:MAG: TlpA family protein disulfide reductase [gamma proteobacterium symbiont of Bathyaustriella thionipta]|nr:TlpA family protein disulfide reductase [gamma proteobacterium symbiont of Bathyaustriella thionipta]MCU7950433.1 TlpA family protein disulfide reductase [gamma proteobacterium symbiont of Bathyaustriella thionipta]MCU7953419.1 TlpA family protein disulfide reductase [gamma proteobacterium symbiont of Bathyaustriella thionipta]MCU7956939.1 TlpA family protein disulfide reductase [gamma proteobacterium symbiont of Bathyaustriella thionipta]MCU7966973.1 TlpA family protein disulfide reductase 
MYIRLINTIILFVFIYLSNSVIAMGTLETIHNNKNIASFELKGIDNHIYRLSDYQGKVVLVNFWASWCPACIQELPSMQRLEKVFTDQPFEIVAINVSEVKKKVIYQAKLNHMNFTVLLDPESKTLKQWRAKILPTSYIIDKKGHIRYLAQGPLEWDSTEVATAIEKLLIE